MNDANSKLRSPELQALVAAEPHWVLRWGFVIVSVLLAGLMLIISSVKRPLTFRGDLLTSNDTVDGTCIGTIRVQNNQAAQVTLGQRVGVRLRSRSDTVYYLSVCEVQKDPLNDEFVQAIVRMPSTIVCGTTPQFEIVVESQTIFQEIFFHLQ